MAYDRVRHTSAIIAHFIVCLAFVMFVQSKWYRINLLLNTVKYHGHKLTYHNLENSDVSE